MADTLPIMIETILRQINDEYEIVVVDDGSGDNSVQVLEELEAKHSQLRVIKLPRDHRRKLGETRNISVRESRGEWCIFHLDADDAIGPYVKDFVSICEFLQKGLDKPNLFSGKQIHVAKRDFLLAIGPFRNIYRGEDRDLYARLAVDGQWKIIEHERFIRRLDHIRPSRKILKKKIYDLWDQIVSDVRVEREPLLYLFNTYQNWRQLGIRRVILRFLLAPFATARALQLGFLDKLPKLNGDEFVRYRSENTRSYSDWAKVLNITSRKMPSVNVHVFYIDQV